MRNKRAVSLLLVICMICCVLFLFAGCSGDSDVAEIRDSALRNKLTELLGKDAGEDILISELNDFNGYIDLSDTNVKNLAGIEHAGSTAVNLSNTRVTDLTPLAGMQRLRTLTMTDMEDEIDVSPLAECSNLAYLDLSRSQVLNLSALSGTHLTELTLKDCEINSLSELSELPAIETLDLSGNQISDISILSSFTTLKHLNLSGNPLSSADAVSTLTSLQSLDLSATNIQDISPLQDLTSLNSLSLAHNGLTDISSLSELTAVTNLDVSYNQISDISPVEKMSEMSTFIANDNQISDVQPMHDFGSAYVINLANNNITDPYILQSTFRIVTSSLFMDLRGNPLNLDDSRNISFIQTMSRVKRTVSFDNSEEFFENNPL